MSSSRKPLIRNSSHSDRPTTMRNWPLFAFLIGLVLFFYIFYVYQAQGAALTEANEEVRQLSSQLSLTKGKLVSSLADYETSNSDKKTLATQLDDVTKKNDECMVSLRNTKLRVDGLEKDTKTNTENYTKMQEELTVLKAKADELQRNNTALTALVSTQEQLITQLNQTIGIIKFEKEELKNAANLTPKTEKPAEKKEEEEVTVPTTSTSKTAPEAAAQQQPEEAAHSSTTPASSTVQNPAGANVDEKVPENPDQPDEPEPVVAEPEAAEPEEKET